MEYPVEGEGWGGGGGVMVERWFWVVLSARVKGRVGEGWLGVKCLIERVWNMKKGKVL